MVRLLHSVSLSLYSYISILHYDSVEFRSVELSALSLSQYTVLLSRARPCECVSICICIGLRPTSSEDAKRIWGIKCGREWAKYYFYIKRNRDGDGEIYGMKVSSLRANPEVKWL